MMKKLVATGGAAVVGIAVFASSAAAACRDYPGFPVPAVEKPQVAGRFHYAPGRGLACVLDHDSGQAMAENRRNVTFRPCLKIGAVAVGDNRAKVEALLGRPAAVVSVDDHTESRVYAVPQKTVVPPRYVVVYLDDVAMGVQLLGPPMQMPADFSGLVLGDRAQQVVDALGPPAKVCKTMADGPETWMWGAFPIAVDMLDGYAAGFKVTWPAKSG